MKISLIRDSFVRVFLCTERFLLPCSNVYNSRCASYYSSSLRWMDPITGTWLPVHYLRYSFVSFFPLPCLFLSLLFHFCPFPLSISLPLPKKRQIFQISSVQLDLQFFKVWRLCLICVELVNGDKFTSTGWAKRFFPIYFFFK